MNVGGGLAINYEKQAQGYPTPQVLVFVFRVDELINDRNTPNALAISAKIIYSYSSLVARLLAIQHSASEDLWESKTTIF